MDETYDGLEPQPNPLTSAVLASPWAADSAPAAQNVLGIPAPAGATGARAAGNPLFPPAIPGTIRNANEIPQNMIGPAAPNAGGTAGIPFSRVVADNAVGTRSTGIDQLFHAIYGQESGYGANNGPSVNGAIGPGQILPGTFAQYAKPGESINNPADNIAVSRRILSDYMDRYGGDASRAAVAYFSGPGNVAPPGSPTPWLRDSKDGNGKSVSSYVGDIQQRLAGGGAPAPATTAGASPSGGSGATAGAGAGTGGGKPPGLGGLYTMAMLQGLFPQHAFTPVDYNPFKVQPKIQGVGN